jgi:ribosomal protein S16
MENTTRRDGRPVEEVGYYDPIVKNIILMKLKFKNG